MDRKRCRKNFKLERQQHRQTWHEEEANEMKEMEERKKENNVSWKIFLYLLCVSKLTHSYYLGANFFFLFWETNDGKKKKKKKSWLHCNAFSIFHIFFSWKKNLKLSFRLLFVAEMFHHFHYYLFNLDLKYKPTMIIIITIKQILIQ